MALTRKPTLGGFGLGAATPARPRYPIEPNKDWEPSVTRPKVGGVPQADQATPPRTPPIRRYPGPAAGIPRITPRVNQAEKDAAAQRQRILGSGIGNVVDRADAISDRLNPTIKLDEWVDKRVEGIKPTAIRTPIKLQTDSYRGLLGKVYLGMDIASVKQSINEAISPDTTAERLYNANPGNYSSIEEAKREVQAYNTGEIVGTVAENVAQVGVNAFLGWAIRGLLTAGAAAVGIGTGGVGFIAFATIASVLATTLAYGKAVELTQPENPEQGDLALSAPGTYESMMKNEQNDWGALAEGGPGASFIGNVFKDQLAEAFIWSMNAEPKQNTREQVSQIRGERGTYEKAPELQWTDDEGFSITVPMYASWGRRTDEVHALFSAGYFLTPVMDTEGKPYTQGNGIRAFEVDYVNMIKWMQDTDWLTNRSGLATRVMQLPKVDNRTVELMKETPITADEYRTALKWWYTQAEIQYEQNQAAQAAE